MRIQRAKLIELPPDFFTNREEFFTRHMRKMGPNFDRAVSPRSCTRIRRKYGKRMAPFWQAAREIRAQFGDLIRVTTLE